MTIKKGRIVCYARCMRRSCKRCIQVFGKAPAGVQVIRQRMLAKALLS